MTAITIPLHAERADLVAAAPERSTAWERNAACRSLGPETARLFFSDDIGEISRAKQICATCPAIVDCLDTAIEQSEQWGVWGGQLFVSGKIVMAKRRRGRPPKHARPEDQLPVIPFPDHLRHLQPA